MTSAFGKLILLGEHAVVYGHSALAGALERGVRATARPLDRGPSTLRVAQWSLDITSEDAHPVAEALRALLAEIGAGPLALEADARVAAAAGLGSSAALSVALTRAIAEAQALTLAPREVERIANCAERCFHSNPSGIDVALAARGGLGLYRRDSGLRPIDAEPITVAVGLSGTPRRTADMVALVGQARETDRGVTEERLGELGAAAERGARALERGDCATLGQLMSRAHRLLSQLGVSAPVLDRLVETALAAGALGAKLTGAGGGGAVIALAPGREDEVIDAWRGLGYDCFACSVGAREVDARTDGGHS